MLNPLFNMLMELIFVGILSVFHINFNLVVHLGINVLAQRTSYNPYHAESNRCNRSHPKQQK